MKIEGSDLLQTDPLSFQLNCQDEEIKVDDMEVDTEKQDREMEVYIQVFVQ